MAKKANGFTKAKLSRCDGTAHVHVGAIGKGHRGCHHNAKKLLCVWERS